MMRRRPCPDLREFHDEIMAYVLPKTIRQPNGCLEWQGHLNTIGYAEGSFQGRVWIITRLIVCATKGTFDPQLDVCHTCDNTKCVEQGHLWPGTRKANSKDCIEKRRHYKVQNTHCPRGHSYAVHGKPHASNPNWRVCYICERARSRIRHGWPKDLAYSLETTPPGYKPVNINILAGKPKKGRVRKTHCKRGHALEGENLYKKPNGRFQCKICHDAAAAAWLARGKVPLERFSHNG